MDLENRRNVERLNTHPARSAPTSNRRPSANPRVAPYDTTQRTPRFLPSPVVAAQAKAPAAPKFSTSPIPPPKPMAHKNCFLCGKPGHFANQCPTLPTVRAIVNEIDITPDNAARDIEDDVNMDEPEETREGNGEA